MNIKRFFKRPPDFIVGGEDNPYLLRWWILPRNKYFNIYLHKFLRDDEDRALHDHPWRSLSIIVKGGYIEHTPKGAAIYFAGRVKYRSANYAHRIALFRNSVFEGVKTRSVAVPAWTIFITGPKIREWGFHCPKGWRHWRDFTAPHDKGQIGRGCE